MTQKTSYEQILKSSSIMGGAAIFTLVLSMVRIKLAAVLIGTLGVGILSNLNAIQGLITGIAGLGIKLSAVRNIAAAVEANNDVDLARSVLSLRRICWLTGCVGMISTVLLSSTISQWTFGSKKYSWDIAALGIAILLANIQGGQLALIQGMRRMEDLAKVQIIGALAGTSLTALFYVLLGIRGIVPALVILALIQLLVSWRFSRKIALSVINMSWKESFIEINGTIYLGIAMMWSGLLVTGISYATNALITHHLSLQAVGIYSAAFALSGTFINFVLNAMTADYFPRLSGIAHDKSAVNRLVNEQTEIGLLLATPGVMATIALAPFVIQIFYSQEFLSAADLLQWLVMGCLGRVISWPLSFVMLALDRRKLYFLTETGGQLLNIIFTFIGIIVFGLEGIAIGYLVMYILYVMIVFYVAKKLTNFNWTQSCKNLLIGVSVAIATVFCTSKFLPLIPAVISNVILVIIGSSFSLRGLAKRIDESHRMVKIIYYIPGMRSFTKMSLRIF